MQTRSMLSPSFDSNVPYNYNHTEWSSPERSTGPAAAGLSLTTASGVMVAVTLTSVALFVILLCFCLRRKQCWGAIPAIGRIRPVDAAEPSEPVGKGLDASAVRALPSFMFWSEGCAPEGPLLCAVCIAELADGEAALRLPKCDHGFHLECIEAWLRSHSSCPLCRRPVVPGPPEVPDVIVESVRAQFPAVASGGRISGLQEDATLVIELSSPTSPMPSPGLSSLRRLLMLGGRGVGSAHSPAEHDMEHGDAPKTPAR